MTPHISSKNDEIAKVVLMPGDPLRAKYIADNFLENSKLVNSVRNMLAYTGTYKGKEITVFASGMGMPSIVFILTNFLSFMMLILLLELALVGLITKI